MRTKIDKLDRIELFNHYNEETNPFLYITIKIDITSIYNKCKHYYPSIAFFLHQAIEKIDNFKLRYENGSIYHYDHLKLNFTEKREDDNITFFNVDYTNNYKEFMDNYFKAKEQFLNSKDLDVKDDHGEIWYSCVPWFNFSQVLTPFNKKVTIPQLIWDKFIFENDKVYVNLMIMVHHGFVDGFHLKEFLQTFEDIVKNIDNYL